jgi:RNA polymerase sigma-70 factor (ECF subfamily)
VEDRARATGSAGQRLSDADAWLLEQIRSGNAEAGHQFVREHYRAIYRYLLYLTEQPDLAEDLTQETFLQAWRHLDTFQGRGSLRSWLHRIARREFLDLLQRRQAEAGLDGMAEVAAPDAMAWMESVELRSCIHRLPLEEREVLLLHYLEGYSSAEIAPIVGAPARTVRRRLAQAREHLRQELGEDDLTYLNEPLAPMRQWAWLPLDQMQALEARLAMGSDAKEDTMERREFLRQAAMGVTGLALSQPGKEVVDGRLTQKVTCAFKGTALSDLCDHLSTETGVHLTAGPSVADEKVTLFCKQMPLREVMRQLSRPFGYTWLRSQGPGPRSGEPETAYRYELVEDMRSQLLEEELRTRDRNAALLALDEEMQSLPTTRMPASAQGYRPLLHLSPEEAEARATAALPSGRTGSLSVSGRAGGGVAAPVEQPLLENLSRYGWGPIQMYFRLSREQMAALRAGETLIFSAVPRPGEYPLPADVARGVLQGLRYWRVTLGQHAGDQMGIHAYEEAAKESPDKPAPAALPEARVRVDLSIHQIELGRFAFSGGPGCFSVSATYKNFDGTGPDGPWVIGRNPTAVRPNNRAINARWERDRSLHARVSVSPQPSCRLEKYPGPIHYPREKYPGRLTDPRRGEPPTSAIGEDVTSADVLEALHRASGVPIVSDYYTRLYKPEDLCLRNHTLFDALNQLADGMGLRWDRDPEGGWLRFRSASFYTDRLKEVPNRLLTRWSAARKEQGYLTLDDLVEIAQLSDAQLDPRSMAEGARACFGLVEWELARHPVLRPLLQDLAHFSPAQRQEAMKPAGLRFDRMSPAQQLRFLSRALDPEFYNSQAFAPKSPPTFSLGDMEGAVLWIDYTQPGGFEWVPHCPGPWQTWVMAREPGPDGRREPRPPVRGRTREATLQAFQRVDPKLLEAIYESLRRDGGSDAPPADHSVEIFPIGLSLTFIYIPGASHKHPVRILGAGMVSSQWTGQSWEREW